LRPHGGTPYHYGWSISTLLPLGLLVQRISTKRLLGSVRLDLMLEATQPSVRSRPLPPACCLRGSGARPTREILDAVSGFEERTMIHGPLDHQARERPDAAWLSFDGGATASRSAGAHTARRPRPA